MEASGLGRRVRAAFPFDYDLDTLTTAWMVPCEGHIDSTDAISNSCLSAAGPARSKGSGRSLNHHRYRYLAKCCRVLQRDMLLGSKGTMTRA